MEDGGCVKQAKASYLGLLLAQGATAAESKFLSLRNPISISTIGPLPNPTWCWWRQLPVLILLVGLCVSCGPAGSGTFAQGQKYAESGDHAKAIEVWSPLAAKGHLPAQLALAAAYARGDGVTQDYQRAHELYVAAADQDSAQAQYVLGLMHYHGDGVPPDSAKAFLYFEQAAQQGHAKAQIRTGQAYQQGDGVPRSLAQAYQWFASAEIAENKQAPGLRFEVEEQARSELGADDLEDALALAAAFHKDRKFEQARQLLEQFANAGHAAAQAELGFLYWLQISSSGDAATSSASGDYTKVVHWSRLAAEQGHPVGMNNLGMLYKDGLGVPQDHARALALFRRATKLKAPRAMLNLAYMYNNGLGVSKDTAQGQALIREAADLGFPKGQYYVGRRYHLGNGVPQDYEEARRWFELAANQGYSPAQTVLGGLYFMGQGVPKDLTRAFEWMGVGVANAAPGKEEADARAMFAQLVAESDAAAIERGSQRLRKTLPVAMAAAVGDPKAQVDMGYMAAATDRPERAGRLFSASAEQGFVEGMNALGGWYLLQQSREARIESLKWYTLVAAGNGKQEETLDRIATLISSLDKAGVDEAADRARRWRPVEPAALTTNKEEP